MPRCSASQLTLLSLLLLTAGCGTQSLFLGSGAIAAGAAMQERGMGGAMSDYNLRMAISDAWFQSSLEIYQHCSLMISRGRVVMIGFVPTEELKNRAATLAIGKGAVNPVNRIKVYDFRSVLDGLTDEALSARIDTALLFDRDVSAINYDIETRGNTVYVIGEAQSEREVRRVLFLTQQIAGTRHIESFIEVVGNSQ